MASLAIGWYGVDSFGHEIDSIKASWGLEGQIPASEFVPR